MFWQRPRNAPEGVRQAQGTLHIVVGEDPAEAASRLGENTTVLASGHADIAVQAYTGRLVIRADSGGKVTEHDWLARSLRFLRALCRRFLRAASTGS